MGEVQVHSSGERHGHKRVSSQIDSGGKWVAEQLEQFVYMGV